ncbi:MAG: dephospho-CoA kinase [Chloroflexota bacterium]|jgi:dephospho-CoA kinase|nr:dephospho-CoA kinase [Chloroflexota bacterium]
MRIIGLTGGIGSGKSTVSAMLRELGAAVVDADAGARAVVEPGQPGLAEIGEAFGPDVLRPDGSLDREKVAALVFSDPEARARLDAITHPRVREWMAERVQEAVAAGSELVVLDVPLMYESGLEGGVESVIVVWASPETQVSRAVERGMTEADARARVAAQMPIDEKRARADHVVDNSGSVDATRRQVEHLWAELTGDSA